MIWSVKLSTRQRTEMDSLPLPVRHRLRPPWFLALDSILCLSIIVLAAWLETEADWRNWLLLTIASGLALLHGWFAIQSIRVLSELLPEIQPEQNRALRVEAISHSMALLIYAIVGIVYGLVAIL